MSTEPDTDDEPSANQLRDRVANLEQTVSALNDQLSETDDSGEEWSLAELMDLGLTRRQAMAALVALGAWGASLGGAIRWATQNVRAADDVSDSVGTASNQVDLYLDEIRGPSDNVFFDVDNGSATSKPSDIDLQDFSTGSTQQLIQALESGDDTGIDIRTRITTGVSTTATTIINMGSPRSCGLVVVQGEDGNGAIFVDAVLYERIGKSTNVLGSVTDGTPASRSYSGGSGGDIDLAMGSDTYDVVATTHAVGEVRR